MILKEALKFSFKKNKKGKICIFLKNFYFWRLIEIVETKAIITNKSIAIGLPATGPLILVTVFVVTGFGSRVGFCSGSV